MEGKYIVVMETDLVRFTQKVNQFMELDYGVLGPPFSSNGQLMQAMLLSDVPSALVEMEERKDKKKKGKWGL